MKFIKRFIYFLYYLKKLDYSKFFRFLKFVAKETNKPVPAILFDCIISSFRYNIGLMDYFYFRFYGKKHEERVQYAGTGFMYEYHLIMNPLKCRNVLNDKLLFLQRFSPYVKHDYINSSSAETYPEIVEKILKKPSGKFVLKAIDGQCGEEVKVHNSAEFSADQVLKVMRKGKLDLIEDYLVQHPELMELSPAGLNTVRIFTQFNQNDELVILGARLRITVNSHVDNLAAGNLAAPVDENTGIVNGPAVYSDITKDKEVVVHPITGQKILGFQVPFWNETMQMVKEAALSMRENRSIGWDVAITENGPELLEGNHNWCKLLWQLPVNKGMKNELEAFL